MMRKVRLQNVPLLRELEIDGMHLETINIDGAEFLTVFPLVEKGIVLVTPCPIATQLLRLGFSKSFRTLEIFMALKPLNFYPCPWEGAT